MNALPSLRSRNRVQLLLLSGDTHANIWKPCNNGAGQPRMSESYLDLCCVRWFGVGRDLSIDSRALLLCCACWSMSVGSVTRWSYFSRPERCGAVTSRTQRQKGLELSGVTGIILSVTSHKRNTTVFFSVFFFFILTFNLTWQKCLIWGIPRFYGSLQITTRISQVDDKFSQSQGLAWTRTRKENSEKRDLWKRAPEIF